MRWERSRKWRARMRDNDFIVGLLSAHARIIFISAATIHVFPGKILNWEFHNMYNIRWNWRVTLVVPRILSDVLHIMRINHESYFWVTSFGLLFFVVVCRAILGDIAGLRNNAFFHTKCFFPRCDEKSLRRGECEKRFLSADYYRIIVGSRSNRLYFGGSNSESFRWNLALIRGRRSIWRSWSVIFSGRRSIW